MQVCSYRAQIRLAFDDMHSFMIPVPESVMLQRDGCCWSFVCRHTGEYRDPDTMTMCRWSCSR